MTNCSRFVDDQFNFDGTQVLHYSAKIQGRKRSLTVSLVGRVLPQDSLQLAMIDRMPEYNLAGTSLRIIQGDNPASFDATQTTSTMLRDMYQVTQNTINSQRETIDSLRTLTADIARNDTLGATITPEIKVLFPDVKDIAVTRAIVSDVADGRLDTLNVALVTYGKQMPKQQIEKFKEYLQARLRMSDIVIVGSNQLGK